MSPPIHKDWWLAAALTGAALPAALAQTAPADRRQSALVTTIPQGATSAGSAIYVEDAQGRRLTTGPKQSLHVLFADQSAITLAPNTEIVITDFRFDAQTKEGNLIVDMSKGLLRVVGGFISKKRATRISTATATIGIRGGIAFVGVKNAVDTAETDADTAQNDTDADTDTALSSTGPITTGAVVFGSMNVRIRRVSAAEGELVAQDADEFDIEPGMKCQADSDTLTRSPLTVEDIRSFNAVMDASMDTSYTSSAGDGKSGDGKTGGAGRHNPLATDRVGSPALAQGGGGGGGGGGGSPTLQGVLGGQSPGNQS